jgi:SOUL heme-binding protein
MAVETPAYEVLRRDGPFELRRYGGYLTANVHVMASGYGQAANAGFNPLADYIFGNNRESGRIAMTAPVSTRRASGQKIAMTAPVTATQSEDGYVVSFTMPSEFSMEDLPQPNNPQVRLEVVTPRVIAAVRFGGYVSYRSAAKARAELEAWMDERGLPRAGEPIVAQYDPPWKPWFSRRNEILIPVEEASSSLR